MDFAARKASRREYYERFVKGWKLKVCLACNGSGHYDHDGAPACSSCEGTGKELIKPEKEGALRG